MRRLVATLGVVLVALIGTVAPAQAVQPPPSTAQPTIAPIILGVGKGLMWALTAAGVVDAAANIISPDVTPEQTANLAQRGSARDVSTLTTRDIPAPRQHMRVRSGRAALLEFGITGILGAVVARPWSLGSDDPGRLVSEVLPKPAPPLSGMWANQASAFRTHEAMHSVEITRLAENSLSGVVTMDVTVEAVAHPDNPYGMYAGMQMAAYCTSRFGTASPDSASYYGGGGGVFSSPTGVQWVEEWENYDWRNRRMSRSLSGTVTIDCTQWSEGDDNSRLVAVGFGYDYGHNSLRLDDAGKVINVPTLHGGEGQKVVAWGPAADALTGGGTAPAPEEPAGARHRLTTTIKCTNANGQMIERSGSSEWFEIDTAADDWESPEAPELECPPGTWLAEMQPLVESEVGTESDGSPIIEQTTVYEAPIQQPDWGHQLGREMAENPDNLPDAGVEFRTDTGEWVRCENAGTACQDWQLQMQTKPGTYRCTMGTQVVAMKACDPLARWYNHTPVLTSPAPPTAPEGPVGSDEAGECFPQGWGLFNPVEWVLKPLKCAFIPSGDGIATQWQATANDIGSRPPMSIATAVVGVVGAIPSAFSAGSGCTWQPDFGHGIVLPCDPDQGPWIGLFRALASIAIVVMTAFALGRILYSAMKKEG